MRYSLPLFIGLLFSCFLGCISRTPARADALAHAGRDIVDKNRQAVVTLLVTTKTRITGGGDETTNEDKSETVGAVIDESGLVVTSLTSLSYSTDLGTPAENGAGAGDEVHVMNEVSALTILVEGGRDIPAHIVLRDKDHDLVFIRPLKPLDKPLQCINLSTAATPELLDETILLDRLNTACNRSISALPCRIIAVVDKPHPFFVLLSVGNNLGTPLFTLDGKFIGIRTVQQSPQGSGGKYGQDVMDIIRPATDIAKAAAQAK